MKANYDEVNILLIDDDDVDAIAVERGFRSLKIANPVIRAKNGEQALEILRGTEGREALARPYIILLDLNMPIMSGLEFLHYVREDTTLKDAIIFVLTTSEADEDRVAAYNENVAGYIVKSNVQNDFTKVIEMLDNYWRVVLLPT